MKRDRRDSGPRVLFISFAISAFVHLILAFPLKDLVESYLNAKAEPRSVRVVQLSQQQWAKNFQSQKSKNRPPQLKDSPADRKKKAAREPLPPSQVSGEFSAR